MIVVLVEEHCVSVVGRRWGDGYMRSRISSSNGVEGAKLLW